MIEVKNLVKKYGTHTAVDDISFSIDKGRIYGFLGPNGAGKTTTMNIITGYLAATEGSVVINGYDILKEPEKAKSTIGYLPEVPPVYPDATIREYLTFAAALKGIPEKERRVQCEVALRKLGLADVADRLTGSLSKGYRQRIGLAQAMLGFPETIILDEPMVGLDPQQIIEMRRLIRSLSKNHTVILSSHILAEVRELCDNIMIISKGRMIAQDTPENLEERLGEDETIELEVKCEIQELKDIISSVRNISDAKYTRLAEDMYSVTLKPDHADIREEIFRAFARHDRPLTTLRREAPSLEDIYLKLIQEGAQ